jgi:thiamine biosynthesis lipoprotein
MTQSQHLSRRGFLRISAILGLGVSAGGWLLAHETAAVTVSETRLLMGSIANLTVVSADAPHARLALTAAFDRMQALEAIFSRFQPESWLSQLNRTGSVRGTPPEFRTVIDHAVKVSDLSEGAFDISVEPLLALYRAAARSGDRPDAVAVKAARALIDYRAIDIRSDQVRLLRPGMALTLDGIAKGYIIDEGIGTLEAYGLTKAMVEVGGDLHARGPEPWHIGIQSPHAAPDAISRVVEVHNQALTTSGDYVSTFTDDRSLHHILDPRSGLSPTELSSVSVTASSACTADALSTALMVMGVESGVRLLQRMESVSALFIGKDGRVTASSRGST